MTATVKVKPWGEGQGDFVIINAEDLTDAHELFEPSAVAVKAEASEAEPVAPEPAAERQKRPYTRRS